VVVLWRWWKEARRARRTLVEVGKPFDIAARTRHTKFNFQFLFFTFTSVAHASGDPRELPIDQSGDAQFVDTITIAAARQSSRNEGFKNHLFWSLWL
jgi:nucleosome binding factor SPN SPT16 subunit